MACAARDYRTTGGLARRASDENVLGRYIRVARVAAPHLSATYPLPLARPRIDTALAAADYRLLLDVLDELTILEAAARYSDRKSQTIARRRLHRAVAAEIGCRPSQIDRLFRDVNRQSVPIIRRTAEVLIGRVHACASPFDSRRMRAKVYQLDKIRARARSH